MARFVVRVNRFDDRRAFERCLKFLARLRPELTLEQCEAALAKLPAVLSHDADEAAANALANALQGLGAKVVLLPVGGDGYGATQELSPQIDLSFLDAARRKEQASSSRPAGDGKAPWEP
jgi:hypothetical protein